MIDKKKIIEFIFGPPKFKPRFFTEIHPYVLLFNIPHGQCRPLQIPLLIEYVLSNIYL